jgi:8-oxo-dGTP pyrophosphatase MutT (NUDIX family)
MREVWKPSVTVAAIVEQNGRFLLLEEHTQEGLRLNNPAGHLEPGESPLQGVMRETLEETACVFSPDGLIGVYLSRFQRPDEDVTYLRFAFRGAVSQPVDGRSLDHGIVRTLWMTPDEVRASQSLHRSPLVLQCVEDHLAGKLYALDLISTHASVQALQTAMGS